MTLTLSATIENNSIYRYIPELALPIGQEPKNFFVDLAKSLNIFNADDLIESDFNLQRINFSLVHDLSDWEFRVDYSGSPELIREGGQSRYEWQQQIEFKLIWKPVPELDNNIKIDKEGKVVFDET